jgi:uroporphyrinogen-III decarboxylase
LGAAVRLHICGDTRAILDGMGRLGVEMVDMDFPSPVRMGREKMGPEQVICGNINPVSVLQDGSVEDVRQAIEVCHREAGNKYIVGAGCEVTRQTPIENLRVLTDYALSH